MIPGPLEYNGGPVMHTNTTYAIYWIPSGYSVSPSYQNLINQYFSNVAADSRRATNVYSNDTQYYDTSGAIRYQSGFTQAAVDTDSLPASGCFDTDSYGNPMPACLTDAQLQQEIATVIAKHGWSPDLTKEFFLYTADGIGSCTDGSSQYCSYTYYCAYHSNFGASGDTVYSNMPYGQECYDGQGTPNGDPAADTVINVSSHEHNESITDPQPDSGWLDSGGQEIGDKCAWEFGTPLGYASNGQPYNQQIGSSYYDLQSEWSNAANGCVYQALPAVSGVSPNRAPAGASVAISGTGFTNATTVMFGANWASFTVNSDSVITATVPSGNGTVEVTVTTPGGSSGTTAADQFTYGAIVSGAYHALSPTRILDTRPGTQVGPYNTPFGSGTVRPVQITGQGGVPGSGVAAVVLNATVTDTIAPGYLTLFPAGQGLPTASNINWSRGEAIANLVTVPVGSGGQIDAYAYIPGGSVDVVLDVEGWYDTAAVGMAGRFQPLAPKRILDTRPGTQVGPYGSPFTSGMTRAVQITGQGDVPISGVAAVVLNITVTNTTSFGDLTIYPAGQVRPVASNVNWSPQQTIPNRVIVPVGSSGQIDVYAVMLGGSADVIIDVNGWFSDGSVTASSVYTPLNPARILDTRRTSQVGPYQTPFSSGQTRAVAIAGQGGVPGAGVTAVVLNVTVTDATSQGDLTLYPSNVGQPVASDLNWSPNVTVANLAVVQVGPDGTIDANAFCPGGNVDVIIDVEGYFH